MFLFLCLLCVIRKIIWDQVDTSSNLLSCEKGNIEGNATFLWVRLWHGRLVKDFANLCCAFYDERDTRMSLVHLLTTSMTKETFPLVYTFLANRSWVWAKFRHLSVCSSSRTFHTMTPHLSDFFEEKAESGVYKEREKRERERLVVQYTQAHTPRQSGRLCVWTECWVCVLCGYGQAGGHH